MIIKKIVKQSLFCVGTLGLTFSTLGMFSVDLQDMLMAPSDHSEEIESCPICSKEINVDEKRDFCWLKARGAITYDGIGTPCRICCVVKCWKCGKNAVLIPCAKKDGRMLCTKCRKEGGFSCDAENIPYLGRAAWLKDKSKCRRCSVSDCDTSKCSCCGENIKSSTAVQQLTAFFGRPLKCRECTRKQCTKCGRSIYVGEQCRLETLCKDYDPAKPMCQYCLSVVCDGCGNTMLPWEENHIKTAGRNICEDCYKCRQKCQKCHKDMYHNDICRLIKLYNGYDESKPVCESCLKEAEESKALAQTVSE